MCKTLLARTVQGQTQEEKEEKSCKNSIILKHVREVLENEDIINNIVENYNLQEENKYEYETNRKCRIIQVLKEAELNEEEYQSALSKYSKRGVCVFLARDITETIVNNYNGEWIRAWNANLDIQLCVDFFLSSPTSVTTLLR